MPDTEPRPDRAPRSDGAPSDGAPRTDGAPSDGGPPSDGAPRSDADAPRPEPDDRPRERIVVGRINAIWGLKGHVKVTPFTSNDERLVTGAELIVGGRRRIALEVVRPQGYPIIRFEGYPDRTAAERLRGELIEIEADELPALPAGEYYVDDLVGLTVVTTDGTEVGKLEDVLTTGANDVYIVKRPGLKDVLLPAIPDVVVSVDLEAGQMTIDPLPGLLDG